VQEVYVTLPRGSVVHNRYIIVDLLGQGGSGAVYLVRDQRVKGNLFALKEIIKPNKKDRSRWSLQCKRWCIWCLASRCLFDQCHHVLFCSTAQQAR
jgi:serine/threonine protein kinase